MLRIATGDWECAMLRIATVEEGGTTLQIAPGDWVASIATGEEVGALSRIQLLLRQGGIFLMPSGNCAVIAKM